jgi:hypothetical protein
MVAETYDLEHPDPMREIAHPHETERIVAVGGQT